MKKVLIGTLFLAVLSMFVMPVGFSDGDRPSKGGDKPSPVSWWEGP